MSLTQREMTHQAALYGERRSCIVALGACVVEIHGCAGLALVWPAAWPGLAVGLGLGVAGAGFISWRLRRVTRRIEELEKFL